MMKRRCQMYFKNIKHKAFNLILYIYAHTQTELLLKLRWVLINQK